MNRTSCDCEFCQTPCEVAPGYLVPDDIPPYMYETGFTGDTEEWAKENLMATDGIVKPYSFLLRGHLNDDAGPYALPPNVDEALEKHYIRLPTLIPRTNRTLMNESGGCIHHLQGVGPEDGPFCAIHQHSPWGCRMFDAHMDPAAQSARAVEGLFQIYEAWRKHFHPEGQKPTDNEGSYVHLYYCLDHEFCTRGYSTLTSREWASNRVDEVIEGLIE